MADEPYITIDPAQGGYRCHFWGSNNKLVWWTEAYTRKQGAVEVVEFLQHWAPRVSVYERA
jgi:uncharacterized protein YegP (UPF0339 family)